MVRNMCFDRDADDIADTLNGENGIELGDVLSGVIGLARIVAHLDASIRVQQKDLKRIIEDHRKEIIQNTQKIALLESRLELQAETISKLIAMMKLNEEMKGIN